MKYTIVVHRLALEDLDAAYLRMARHAPRTAASWAMRFQNALSKLEYQPQRCGVAPENRRSSVELRDQLPIAGVKRVPQSIAILTGGCLGTLIGLFAGCALGFQMFAREGLAVWLAVLVGAPSGLVFGAAMGQLCIHLATPRITVDAH